MIKTNLIVHVTMVLILMAVAPSAQAATVHIDDTSASISSIIDVPIEVSDASDVGAMDISLTYDPDVLTAPGIVNTGDLTSGALVLNETTIYPDPVTGIETISEADNQTALEHGALANHTADGVVNISIISRYGFSGTGSVAVVRFKVTGSVGDISPLNLSTVAAYNLSAPIIDPITGNVIGYESIPLMTQNGSVRIEHGVTVSIGSATGANDSTVTVQISLANAENITGVSPTITYDPSVVQVQSMTANTSVVAMTVQATNINNTIGRARMSLTASLPGITATDEAPVADVTFHLVGGDGTSTDLEFVDTAMLLSDEDFNVFAPAVIENGSVSVMLPGMCGDVAPYPDCDLTVNMGDVKRLLMNVSYPGQYPLCCEWCADVAPCPINDDEINMGDVKRLLMNVSHPGQYPLCCE